MVLGAGIYQVPLIKKAKELGYRVIVCSIPGNYPGFLFADKAYYTDTTDKEGCLKIAIKEKIKAVCTSGTDVAIPTLGYIVDTLGLTGPSEKSSVSASNKLLMKEAFAKHGVSTANFTVADDVESCIKAVNETGLPCIIKVVDSSGSRGIEIVNSIREVADTYARVMPYTRKPYVIVEKYLQGMEIGAQALVYDGKVIFVMTHSDDIYMGSTGVPVGHSAPLSEKLYDDVNERVREEIEKAVRALGIDNSAINADLIIMNNKPYVLEIGARCGATCLAELVSIYYGVDYYEVLIRTATGTLNPEIFAKCGKEQPATVQLVTSDKNGIFDGHVPQISHPDLVDYSLDCQQGEHIRKFHVGPDRIGHIIVKGNSVKEAKEIAYQILSQIKNELMPHIIEPD